MAQTLNGIYRPNDAASFADDVAVWRKVRGNWNFTDDGGAQGAFTLFTVTGDVVISVWGVCDVNLTSGGAATIEVGIAGRTAGLIAQADATTLDVNEQWHDNIPELNPGDAPLATARQFTLAGGADVILTVATADLTAGDVDFYCIWFPLSIDGSVVGT